MKADEGTKYFDVKFFDEVHKNRVNATSRRHKVQLLNFLITISVVINIAGIDFDLRFLGVSLGNITKYRELYLIVATVLGVYTMYSTLYTEFLRALIWEGIKLHFTEEHEEAYLIKYGQFYDGELLKKGFELPSYFPTFNYLHLYALGAFIIMTVLYALLFVLVSVGAHLLIIYDVIVSPNLPRIITYAIVAFVLLSDACILITSVCLLLYKPLFEDLRKKEALLELWKQDRAAYGSHIAEHGFKPSDDLPMKIALGTINRAKEREAKGPATGKARR